MVLGITPSTKFVYSLKTSPAVRGLLVLKKGGELI